MLRLWGDVLYWYMLLSILLWRTGCWEVVLPLGEMMVAKPGTVLLLFTVESRAVEGFYSVYLIGAA